MTVQRVRLFLAGLAAFLVGVPLTEKAAAQIFDIVGTGIGLGFAVADASDGS